MKLAAVAPAILALSSASALSPRRPLPEAAASLRVPRGGAGIFGKVMDAVEDKSRDLAEYSKVKAAELDEATDRIRDEALESARRELDDLERESKRLAAEAESAARKKAAEVERAARTKATDLASAARETALQVATRWEKEARKKANDVEKAVRRKATEVERESRKRVAQIEKSITSEEDGVIFQGTLGSIFRRGSKEPLPPPPPPPLLSAKTGAVLAHALLLAILCTSLSNLAGYPPAVVDHWEGGFGDKFFPSDAVTLAQKRALAGAMELGSIFLMRPKRTRAAGVGLIAVMYTWGAAVSTQLNSAGKAVVLAVLSAVAWLLLANEVF